MMFSIFGVRVLSARVLWARRHADPIVRRAERFDFTLEDGVLTMDGENPNYRVDSDFIAKLLIDDERPFMLQSPTVGRYDGLELDSDARKSLGRWLKDVCDNKA